MATSRHSLTMLIAICGGALVAVYACQDDGVVGPQHVIQGDLEPILPDSGAFVGSYTLPTPPNNNVGFPDSNTGIALPPGVVVRVTVSGKLTFTPNPAWPACWPYGYPPLPGGVTVIGPAGDQGTYQVDVASGTTGPGHHLTLTPTDVSADPISGTVGVAGSGYTLWAGRPVVYRIECGQQNVPAYLVSGTQTITVASLPPPKITVDRTTVVSGDTVTATLSASWTTNLDLYYAYWQWVADTGVNGGSGSFVPGSGCGSTTSCRVIVHGDGHLQVPNVNLDGTQLYQTAVSPTIHVAQAHLTLTVDSSHVASGSQVKFTAHRGDAKPVVVQSWVWTPGSTSPVGPIAVDCAGGDSLCITVLQNTSSTGGAQTGTMMAVALLGTAAESASASVTVDAPVAGCTGPLMAARVAPSRSLAKHPYKQLSTVRTRRVRVAPLTSNCGGGGGGPAAMQLAVSRDTLVPLYPRIRADVVNSVSVAERQPDTAYIQVRITQGGTPVPSNIVTVRAEWLPTSGGHSHIGYSVRFDDLGGPELDVGLIGSLPAWQQPQGWPTGCSQAGCSLFGYFLDNSGAGQASLHLATDANGYTVIAPLVAGYIGGRARIIVSTAVGGQTLVDTAIVGYAVSGLVNLQARIPINDVYWIGGTTAHPQDSNFYVQDSLALRLDTIARALETTVNNQALYLQYNDASLVQGGTFTAQPQPIVWEHPFSGGHVAHDAGFDQDIGLCYANAQGDDGGILHLVGSNACNSGGYTKVDFAVLQDRACRQHGATRIHYQTHFHIRFVGSTENAPGCST